MKSHPVVPYFLAFIEKTINDNQLFSKEDKLLIGVSGGIDSVVLVKVLTELGFSIGIAHVNYRLRGIHSDQDALFVKELAKSLNVPFYSMEVNTQIELASSGLSIQEFARNVRYDFFNRICEEAGYTVICTAHHADDQAETILFRFAKGAGWKGLLGIPIKNKNIARPLLYADKAAILSFASNCQITWREDASNMEDKYARNHIRHHVLPALKKINPSFDQTFLHDQIIRSDSYKFYIHAVKEYWKRKVTKQGNILYVSCKDIGNHPGGQSLLYEVLNLFHFNTAQVARIYEAICKRSTGVLFRSVSFELLLYRSKIHIRAYPTPTLDATAISDGPELQLDLRTWKGRIISSQDAISDKYFSCPIYPDTASLRLRVWQQGDFIFPNGMNGSKKKLSDYFNDLGISRFERDQILMLCHYSKVIWLPGFRFGFEEESRKEEPLYYLHYIPDKDRNETIDVFE